jgi:hypothetical protein
MGKTFIRGADLFSKKIEEEQFDFELRISNCEFIKLVRCGSGHQAPKAGAVGGCRGEGAAALRPYARTAIRRQIEFRGAGWAGRRWLIEGAGMLTSIEKIRVESKRFGENSTKNSIFEAKIGEGEGNNRRLQVSRRLQKSRPRMGPRILEWVAG